MAEPEKVVSLLSSLKAGQVLLVGKLRDIIKQEKGGFKFNLVQPAADSYSFPKTFPLWSESRPGALDELVTLRCELRSFSRKGQDKDGASVTYHNIGLNVL